MRYADFLRTISVKDPILFAAVVWYTTYVSKTKCVAMQPWLTAPRPPQPPSHFALIQRWLDKNKEQTSGGFRRSQVSHAGKWDLGARMMSPCLPVGLKFHAQALMWTRARTLETDH